MTAAERRQAVAGDRPFHEAALPDGTAWTQFYRASHGYVLRFPGLADFECDTDHLATTCWPAPGVGEATTRFLFYSQVLPFLLSRQGTLAIHASGVEHDGMALAFVGQSGQGKSTLAASFAMRGHQVVADDGLALREEANAYIVEPNPAPIRLWEDSSRAILAGRPSASPCATIHAGQCFIEGSGIEWSGTPLRLHRMYFLAGEQAASIGIEMVEPAAALIEIVKHSFMLDVDKREFIAAHFEQLTRLVQLPVFYRLVFPRCFEVLPDVHAAIVRHSDG